MSHAWWLHWQCVSWRWIHQHQRPWTHSKDPLTHVQLLFTFLSNLRIADGCKCDLYVFPAVSCQVHRGRRSGLMNGSKKLSKKSDHQKALAWSVSIYSLVLIGTICCSVSGPRTMERWTGAAGNRTTVDLISEQDTLPPEPQAPHINFF